MQYQHRNKTYRQLCTETALEYWDHYAYLYVTWLPRYYALMEEKRALKLRGHALKKEILDEFPDIPFFKLKTREEAESFVDGLSKHELDVLLHEIKCGIESRSYRTVKAKVYDLGYMVRHAKQKKSMFGYDPDYIKSKSYHPGPKKMQD